MHGGPDTLLCLMAVQVETLNGVKVNNMRDLVRLVDECEDGYLHFDLDYNQKVGNK